MKGRTSGRYSVLNRLPRHSSSSLAFLLFGGPKFGNELVAALADLAAGLLEADVVAELVHRFVPGERVEIHRIQKRAV